MVCDQNVLEYLDRQVEQISQRDGDCWDEKLAALRECVAALPETHKQAVSLRYLEGQTAEKIASTLDATREAIKKRLQRSRAMLLECLRRKGVLLESSP